MADERDPPKAPRRLALPEDDKFLEALERWKKRAIAAFALLALLIAMVVALIVELDAVKKVWDAVGMWD